MRNPDSHRKKETDEDKGIKQALVKGGIGAAGAIAALVTGNPALLAASVIAPIASELVGTILPQKKRERYEKLLIYFAAKTAKLDPNHFERKIKSSEFEPLLEQGIHHAVKALTDERIECIAEILARASEQDTRLQIAKQCLSIIDGLDDVELALFLYITELELREQTKFCPVSNNHFLTRWYGNDMNAQAQELARKFVLLATRKLESAGLIQIGQFISEEVQPLNIYELTVVGYTVTAYLKPESYQEFYHTKKHLLEESQQKYLPLELEEKQETELRTD